MTYYTSAQTAGTTPQPQGGTPYPNLFSSWRLRDTRIRSEGDGS